MKNKILAYLLAAGLILGSMMHSVTIPVMAAGAVIRIDSVEEFYEFVDNCELDSWSEGKFIRLETDISLTNVNEMEAIPYFKGSFDGQGHTISGLSISYDGSVQGLFRYIGEGGTVKNLNVVGTVSPQGSMAAVGGIAGENHGTISNCTYTGVVRGSSTTGGIVGNNAETGMISGCRTSGIVHGDHYTGGIAGKNSGLVENCINQANINTSTEEITLNLEYINLEKLRSTENTTDITDTGGIAGYSTGRVESCTNQGTVGYQHVGYNVGGITGRQSGYVNNCVNYGSVYGRKDIGGINGQMEPYHTLLFSESTLTKLDEQLDGLQQRIDRLIGDADDYSDTVTGKLSEMNTCVTEAQDSVDSMLGEVEDVFQADTDTLNELSSRISEIITKLVPVSEDLTDTSGYMERAFKELRRAADDVEDSADISQDGMRYVEKALDEMEAAQADFDTAAAPLESAMEEFANALTAFSDVWKLVQDGDTTENIKKKVAEGTESLSAAGKALETAGKSIQTGMEDIADARTALWDAIPYFEEAGMSLGGAASDAEHSLDEMYRMASSMTETVAGMERILQDLAEKEGLSFAKLDEGFDVSRDTLSDSMTEITDILDFINSTAADKNDRLGEDIQAVSDQIFEITDTIREAFMEEEEKEYVEDISDEDTGEQTEGKTAFSVNYGSIEGDVNVGGITGSMAIEYDFDPEDDIKAEGEKSADFIYQTRAVIRSCKNRGEITAKKNGAGGIVGNMDLGSVIDCSVSGRIASTGGRYTGGIAGYSKADIRDSYAKCTLSGKEYVGGIAGQGNNIMNCKSLVQIEESGEYTGAVAGKADGRLESNYFVSESLAGVDGISYTNQAEPIRYQELAGLEGIPEEFKSFSLTFRTEDEVVYEAVFPYGADLSGIELPEIPEQEGCYAEWEETDYSHLVFDTTVHAVYKDKITALESAKKRQELPILLAEGSFDGAAELLLHAEEADTEGITGGGHVLEMWRAEIPEDGTTQHQIQYLIPSEASDVRIEYRTEDGWIKADAKQDGQYMVWTADGQEIVFRSITTTSYMPLILGASALLLVIILMAVLLRRRKKSGKGKQEEKKKEGEEVENGK